jgi:lysophospholipase L1-like esterase
MNPLKYWTFDEFEITSFKSGLKERKGKTYNSSGTDNTGLCTYTYSDLGFRGDSVKKEGFKVMSLGCSNTEGVGVNYNDTWPSQFTNLISNGVNLNFGTGGRSNDFIVRCLLTYYDVIKPDLVLIMYSSPIRREIYTKDGGLQPFMPASSWGYMSETEDGKKIQNYLTELQNDNEDTINWYKNHLLIKYFLESKSCNWLWNGSFNVPIEYKEFNRFDGEYQNFIDKGVDGFHPGPKQNKSYANKLHDFITQNFPNYLNILSKNKQSLI